MLGLEGYATATLFLLAVAAFLAGLARGFSGFGSALVFMPLASTVIEPKIAAPLLLMIDLFLAIGMIPDAYPQASKCEAITLAIGALIGVPIGAWLLNHTNPITIRWMIVGLIFPMLILLMSGWRYHGNPARLLTVAVGSIAGFFNGLAQVGGPPIVFYWLGGKISNKVMRANIVIYFAMSTVITTATYAVSGLLTAALIGLGLVIGPLYGIGLYLGSHMFGLASEETFRRVCYALIAAAGLFSLPILDGVIR